MLCMNSGIGTTPATIECLNAVVARYGSVSSEPRYYNIVGAATTTLKSSPGVLKTVVLNASLGTSLTIYDNTTAAGTKIATINPGGSPVSLEYNAAFQNGLTIVSVGGTLNATIIFE